MIWERFLKCGCLLTIALVLFTSERAFAATEDEIETARVKGMDYLKTQQLTDGSWEFSGYKTGITALVTLSLIENGMPVTDPVVDKGYRFVKRQSSEVKNTYEVALSVLLMARVGDRLDRSTIRLLGARLLAGQNKGGGWGYSCPQVDASVLNNLKKLERTDGLGDNSCTQFGVLGLWVASRYGVPIEGAMAEVANRFIDGQNTDGGWSYTPSSKEKVEPTKDSMTCAGLFSLTVARATRIRQQQKEASGNTAERGGEKATLLSDPAYAKGFTRVGEFAKSLGPGTPRYVMWSMERLGVLLGLEKLGETDWFAQGADGLIKTQNADGSWSSGKEVLSDTAFSILFLRKANLGSDISRLLEGAPDKQFAVFSGASTERYDTLPEAIKAAKSGDQVRIDSNGPFKVGHEHFDKDITISAGFGYDPVLEFQVGLNPDGIRYRPDKDVDGRYMFKVSAGTTTLEGLRLQMDPPVSSTPLPWKAVSVTGGTLRLLNCVVSEGNRRGMTGISVSGPATVYARNCFFIGGRAAMEILGAKEPQDVTFDNCLVYSNLLVTVQNDPTTKLPADVGLHVNHCSIQAPEAFHAPGLNGKLAIESVETLYKCDALGPSLLPALTSKEGRSWKGQGNVYNLTNWIGAGGKKVVTVTDFKTFQKFWGEGESAGNKTTIAWVNPRKNGGFAHNLNPQDWDIAEKSELALSLSTAGIQAATVGAGEGFFRYREDFRYNQWKRGINNPQQAAAP